MIAALSISNFVDVCQTAPWSSLCFWVWHPLILVFIFLVPVDWSVVKSHIFITLVSGDLTTLFHVMHVQVPDIYEDMLTISARSTYLFSHWMLICEWQEMLFDQLQKPKLQCSRSVLRQSFFRSVSRTNVISNCKINFFRWKGHKVLKFLVLGVNWQPHKCRKSTGSTKQLFHVEKLSAL